MKIYNVKIKTMDSDRRVIENGWVEITDGIISAVESGSPEAVTAEQFTLVLSTFTHILDYPQAA